MWKKYIEYQIYRLIFTLDEYHESKFKYSPHYF